MRPGRAARGLRAVALARVGLVLAQAALAGRYLSGDAAGLRLHERNPELIVILALYSWAWPCWSGAAGAARAGRGEPPSITCWSWSWPPKPRAGTHLEPKRLAGALWSASTAWSTCGWATPVARDPASGALDVAVHSCFFAVGAIVPWARPRGRRRADGAHPVLGPSSRWNLQLGQDRPGRPNPYGGHRDRRGCLRNQHR
jgi:hypothetical protein